MTADVDWDPTCYDNAITDMGQFYDLDIDEVLHSNCDERGDYLHRTVAVHSIQPEPEFFDVHEYADHNDVIDDIVDALSPDILHDIYQVHNIMTKPSDMDYNLLCHQTYPLFYNPIRPGLSL
jgi:hypothetical protein